MLYHFWVRFGCKLLTRHFISGSHWDNQDMKGVADWDNKIVVEISTGAISLFLTSLLISIPTLISHLSNVNT